MKIAGYATGCLVALSLLSCQQEEVAPANLTFEIPEFRSEKEYWETLNRVSAMEGPTYEAWAAHEGIASFSLAYYKLLDVFPTATSEKEVLTMIEENRHLVRLENDRVLPIMDHGYEGRLANAAGRFNVGNHAYRWIEGNLVKAPIQKAAQLMRIPRQELAQPELPTGFEIISFRQPSNVGQHKTEVQPCGNKSSFYTLTTNENKDRRVSIEIWLRSRRKPNDFFDQEMYVELYPEYKFMGFWFNHKTTCEYLDGEGKFHSYVYYYGQYRVITRSYTHADVKMLNSPGFTMRVHLLEDVAHYQEVKSDTGYYYSTNFWHYLKARGKVPGTYIGAIIECN